MKGPWPTGGGGAVVPIKKYGFELGSVWNLRCWHGGFLKGLRKTADIIRQNRLHSCGL